MRRGGGREHGHHPLVASIADQGAVAAKSLYRPALDPERQAWLDHGESVAQVPAHARPKTTISVRRRPTAAGVIARTQSPSIPSSQ